VRAILADPVRPIVGMRVRAILRAWARRIVGALDCRIVRPLPAARGPGEVVLFVEELGDVGDVADLATRRDVLALGEAPTREAVWSFVAVADVYAVRSLWSVADP
jgi:hypothetical protein